MRKTNSKARVSSLIGYTAVGEELMINFVFRSKRNETCSFAVESTRLHITAGYFVQCYLPSCSTTMLHCRVIFVYPFAASPSFLRFRVMMMITMAMRWPTAPSTLLPVLLEALLIPAASTPQSTNQTNRRPVTVHVIKYTVCYIINSISFF